MGPSQHSNLYSFLRPLARGSSYRNDHMRKAVTSMHEEYIEVGYGDKVVFTPKEEHKGHPDVRATWRRSQGLWAHHPVFKGMTTKEIIDWLRGEECDA